MITETIKRDIERSEVFQEKSFGIKQCKKAYKVLSADLYSDKVKAIIREVSCNAYDAHVAAGTSDKPFDVHLPTKLSPHFFVRDYGTGLDREDIETVYTTYFESTKDQSNDEIGCFGLGSKSPFAYVELFTVISYFNGEQYTYSAFINDDGAPSIAHINTMKTDEQNGLKVMFTVKEKDFHEFKYKAESVFKYFIAQPKQVGQIPNIIEPTYKVRRDDWGICENRSTSGQSFQKSTLAIMGNVAYPVQVDLHDLSAVERTFLSKLDVDMHFEIGDLEVNPSRESLSYDESTIAIIREKVGKIIKFEQKRFQKSLNKMDQYYNACLFVMKECDENPLVKALFSNDAIEWKGRQIQSGSNYINFQGADFFSVDTDNRKHFNVVINQINKKQQRTRYGGGKTVITKSTQHTGISVLDTTLIYINDLERGSYSRVRHALSQNPKMDRAYFVNCANKKAVKAFKKHLGMKEIPLLSSVVKPVTIRAPRGEGVKGWMFNWVDTRTSYAQNHWEPVNADFDISEGGFYVPISHWKVGDDTAHSAISPLVEALKTMGHTQPPAVYGVKLAKIESMQKKSNWINLFDFVSMEAKEFIKRPDVIQRIQFDFFNSFAESKHIIRLIQNMSSVEPNENDVRNTKMYKKCRSLTLKRMAREYQAIRNSPRFHENFMKVKRIIERYGLEIDNKAIHCDGFNKLGKEVDARYPLLEKIGYFQGDTLKEVIDYINGIEKLKA